MTQAAWAQRAKLFGETIFSEINALAAEHQAINLGQGAPDFAPPDFVIEAARRAALDGARQQYAPGKGIPELRAAIAEDIAPRLGRRVDPEDEVTITNGATEALFASILALVDPGDEVILLEPFYDSYPANVRIAGGVARFVPLRAEGGRWSFDLDELRAAFSSRTKLIVLNTPHNPTGKIFDAHELEQVAALCREHDALALCDEVYEHLVFEGEHRSLAALDGMWERTLTLSSAGKTFSVTGWKVGWIVAPAEIVLAVRRIHQWIPFAVATPLQIAVAESMRAARANAYYADLVTMYERKRATLLDALAATPLRAFAPEGGYFVMADISALARDDVELCRALIREPGVATIPPSVFYCDDHAELGRRFLRFAFCKDEKTLDEAGRRLSAMR